MCAICYSERAIYEIPDDELTTERVLQEIRNVENRLLGMDAGRPALSVPHLLAEESSAYYHGYVLALMGVEQTRDYFLKRDGHLMDNPKIGPELATGVLEPRQLQTVPRVHPRSLTGETVSATALANAASRTEDEAVASVRKRCSNARHTIPARSRVPSNWREPLPLRTETKSSPARKTARSRTCADRFVTWIEQQESKSA